jgi:drug/metabolite transporter (DMT)-like permease
LVTALLFAGASTVSRQLQAPSWPVWLGGVVISLALFAALALALGPTAPARRAIVARLRGMVAGVRPRP